MRFFALYFAVASFWSVSLARAADRGCEGGLESANSEAAYLSDTNSVFREIALGWADQQKDKAAAMALFRLIDPDVRGKKRFKEALLAAAEALSHRPPGLPSQSFLRVFAWKFEATNPTAEDWDRLHRDAADVFPQAREKAFVAGLPKEPARYAYVVLEQLLNSALPTREKVNALLELIDKAERERDPEAQKTFTRRLGDFLKDSRRITEIKKLPELFKRVAALPGLNLTDDPLKNPSMLARGRASVGNILRFARPKRPTVKPAENVRPVLGRRVR